MVFVNSFWLRKILEELKIDVDGPMKLFCDNEAAISMAHNLVQQIEPKMWKWIAISSKKDLKAVKFVGLTFP